jgi:EmrB/QacA subfamily drug resistance transporter
METGCSLRSITGRWILAATLVASGAAFLMGTAVAVALPSIQQFFDSYITGIQWVVNAQLLTLAALLLVGGSLGDRFGRKKIFILGMTIFVSGAILSGLAGSIVLLITFQAIQGIGAALMIPQSLAIINAGFAENERGKVIGLWAGLSGGIAALGPWVGGWLVESFSWRAVFFMVVPFIALALVITVMAVPESRNQAARKLDWRGTVLIFLGLLGIAYGLISGPVAGWDNLIVLIGLIGGPIAFATFMITELRQKEPLVPLHIFKNPLVAGANTVTLFLYFALNGVIFFLVLNLQQVQKYSPTAAGLALLPPIVIITIFAGPAGALADKIGPRRQMILGPVVVAVGISLLIIGGTEVNYFLQFLPGLILFGAGMALTIAPLTKSALMVAPQFSGSASGANNAISRIAALMAVAVLGVVIVSTFTVRLNDTLAASTLTVEEQQYIISQSDKLGGIVIPESFDKDSRIQARDAINRSFVSGFRWAIGLSAALALVGAAISFFTIRRPPPGQATEQTPASQSMPDED